MLDVLIIGAGPTGLYAAFMAGLRKLNAAVIESNHEAGGQLTAVYKEKFIYDIPGFYKISAEDYTKEQLKQFARFKDEISIHYGEEAIDIEKIDQGFKVTTTNKVIETKYILIAHGGGGFVPQKLKVSKDYNNILYFVKDLEQFRDKKVLVLGGGDSAFDWALAILKYTSDVTLVHRRDEFRAIPLTVELFRSKGKILTPYTVLDAIGDGNIAKGLKLKHAKDGSELILEADYIVVNYGFVLSKSRLDDWKLDGEKGLIFVDSQMRTSQPGIYAAGNGVDYPGKVKLISTGQGEAAIAIQSIYNELHPEALNKFEHSSSLIND